MDIGGLGEKLVALLVDKKLIQDVADLFYLNRDQLINLDRMADKSADNFLKAIWASKNPPYDKFLFHWDSPGRREHVQNTVTLLYTP